MCWGRRAQVRLLPGAWSRHLRHIAVHVVANFCQLPMHGMSSAGCRPCDIISRSTPRLECRIWQDARVSHTMCGAAVPSTIQAPEWHWSARRVADARAVDANVPDGAQPHGVPVSDAWPTHGGRKSTERSRAARQGRQPACRHAWAPAGSPTEHQGLRMQVCLHPACPKYQPR